MFTTIPKGKPHKEKPTYEIAHLEELMKIVLNSELVELGLTLPECRQLFNSVNSGSADYNIGHYGLPEMLADRIYQLAFPKSIAPASGELHR